MIDLCRFMDSEGGLFSRPVPQKLWHIQASAGLPGHTATAFCGDVGYITEMTLARPAVVLARGFEFCEDCFREYRGRLATKTHGKGGQKEDLKTVKSIQAGELVEPAECPPLINEEEE